MPNQNSNLVKFFSLWEKKSKNGKRYWSGKLGNVYVTMFRNTNPHAQAPFFDIFVSPGWTKKGAEQQPDDGDNFDSKPPEEKPAEAQPNPDSEVPF